jgi:hypothetical protein
MKGETGLASLRAMDVLGLGSGERRDGSVRIKVVAALPLMSFSRSNTTKP